MIIGNGIGIGYNIGGQGYSDTRARVANQTNSWTGTVRTVGSGKTYASVGAAYTACNNGDIIEIYGTVDASADGVNNILLNRAGIGVLIRGGSGDNTVDVITETVSSTWTVRIRDGGTRMMFQNLTISSPNNHELFRFESTRTARNLVCENVRFINTNATGGASNRLFGKYDGGNVDGAGVRIELKNCYFSKVSSGTGIFIQNTLADAVVLLTNNTYEMVGNAIVFDDTNLGSIAQYDDSITQNSSHNSVRYGSDTSIPSKTIASVDVRGTTINFGSGFVNHGFLFGRGTDNVYAVDNECTMDNIDNSAAIAFVIKTRSATLGNSIFANNRGTALRPFLIKAAYRTKIQYNTFTGNNPTAISGAFEFTNHNQVDVLTTTENEITYNTFTGAMYGITLNASGSAEAETTSVLNNTIDRNRYSFADNYLLASIGVEYAFADRADFWSPTTNEVNSSVIG